MGQARWQSGIGEKIEMRDQPGWVKIQLLFENA